MRYLGGKHHLSKWVMDNILFSMGSCAKYREPFVGSAAVFSRIAPYFRDSVASDAHLDLVLMWKALAGGWQPPTHVSKEEYEALRHSEPSALRGLVGYGASFGGKWFGGYVDTAWDEFYKRNTRPYLETAARSVTNISPVFERFPIEHLDYREIEVDEETLVYCDPPYAGTTGYTAVGGFDSDVFWEKAALWAKAGATVIVSEESCPEGWDVLSEKKRKAKLRVAVGEENDDRNELLFTMR